MSRHDDDSILRAVRRIPLEAFGRGDLTVLDEVLAPDFVDHSFPPGAPQNADGLRSAVGNVRAAMPDLEVTLDIELRDGDFVVHHTHGHGTQSGPAFGHPPSGRRAVWAETHIYRTRGPVVVEHWGVVKLDSIWQQIGITELPTGPWAHPVAAEASAAT